MNCTHNKTKVNYPFGRKSTPRIVCQTCGKLLKPADFKQERKRNKRR